MSVDGRGKGSRKGLGVEDGIKGNVEDGRGFGDWTQGQRSGPGLTELTNVPLGARRLSYLGSKPSVMDWITFRVIETEPGVSVVVLVMVAVVAAAAV